MNYTIIGTCSICGGAVTVPTVWFSTIPATPTCSSCGSIPAEPYGKIIPMRPAPKVTNVDFIGTQPFDKSPWTNTTISSNDEPLPYNVDLRNWTAKQLDGR